MGKTTASGIAHDQRAGFSLISALLVVAFIGTVIGSGWIVLQYGRPRSSDATASNNQAGNQQAASTTPTPVTAYFTINEWGVRAAYSGSLKLSYTMASGNRSATFSSDQLTALSSDCIGHGGAIVRWAATDKVLEGPPDANTPTAEQAFAGKDPATVPYAHIGSYYYTFAHAQSACGDLTTTAAAQSQTNDAVKALVADLRAIPK